MSKDQDQLNEQREAVVENRKKALSILFPGIKPGEDLASFFKRRDTPALLKAQEKKE